MNENQSAHGDREYGHIVTRMGIERKVVVGHWSDVNVQERIASWMRTAVGVIESSHIRVMRVADNMRNVAVTEGDKVEAQAEVRLGSRHLSGQRDCGGSCSRIRVRYQRFGRRVL